MLVYFKCMIVCTRILVLGGGVLFFFPHQSWLPRQAAGRDTRRREAHASKEAAGSSD